MAVDDDISPDESRMRLNALVRFAQSVADFLLYSHREGFRLSNNTITARAARHFGEQNHLVGAIFSEIDRDAGDWRGLPRSALVQRILETEALSDFVTPIEEDDFWFLDDEALIELRDHHDLRIGDAASLPAWAPPLSTGYGWLREARLAAPSFANVTDIARWLDVSLEEFDTAFGNRRYRLRTHSKANGGVRLIEIPPEPLRVLQRRLLHRLLDRIPTHDSVHGYVLGRSVHTHANAHVGRDIVIRLDLQDFFPSISGARVFLLFRALGYAANIAITLTDLCVARQPRASLRRALGQAHNSLFRLYSVNHLPQGAPTSPALANLCAYSLDTRLAALAKTFEASYTRYADDLVFSGDGGIAEQPGKFVRLARAIISDEGFDLNSEKTRIMRKGARQSFTGLVVNEKVNLPRREYDQLKAAVHRATTQRSSEDLAQLLGRIAWLGQSSPKRANKLRSKLLPLRLAELTNNATA